MIEARASVNGGSGLSGGVGRSGNVGRFAASAVLVAPAVWLYRTKMRSGVGCAMRDLTSSVISRVEDSSRRTIAESGQPP